MYVPFGTLTEEAGVTAVVLLILCVVVFVAKKLLRKDEAEEPKFTRHVDEEVPAPPCTGGDAPQSGCC